MSATFHACNGKNFFIPMRHAKAARDALQRLLEKTDPTDERTFRTLTSAAAAFAWHLEPSDHVHGYTRISYLGEFWDRNDDFDRGPAFLIAIAPFIQKGSYLECTMSSEFRYYFDGGGGMYRVNPIVSWPVPDICRPVDDVFEPEGR